MPKGLFVELLQSLDGELDYENNRGNPLTPVQQLALALYYMASGGLQRVVAEVVNVRQPCANRNIHK